MGWKLGAAEIVLVVTLVVVVNDVATSVVVNFRVRTVVCSSMNTVSVYVVQEHGMQYYP